MSPENPDDATLAAAARDGDRDALELLLERHADRVHSICRAVVHDPHDALDATQEALIAIARGITRFDGRSAFTTWLYRVSTNAALDELRRKGRRPVPTPQDREIAAPSRGTDQVAARIDVHAALAQIPQDFRDAVVMRDLWDYDYSEIAASLGVPVGTVKSRIARGRSALIEILGNQEGPSERLTSNKP